MSNIVTLGIRHDVCDRCDVPLRPGEPIDIGPPDELNLREVTHAGSCPEVFCARCGLMMTGADSFAMEAKRWAHAICPSRGIT